MAVRCAIEGLDAVSELPDDFGDLEFFILDTNQKLKHRHPGPFTTQVVMHGNPMASEPLVGDERAPLGSTDSAAGQHDMRTNAMFVLRDTDTQVQAEELYCVLARRNQGHFSSN